VDGGRKGGGVAWAGVGYGQEKKIRETTRIILNMQCNETQCYATHDVGEAATGNANDAVWEESRFVDREALNLCFDVDNRAWNLWGMARGVWVGPC
jgi:hypothetical protein